MALAAAITCKLSIKYIFNQLGPTTCAENPMTTLNYENIPEEHTETLAEGVSNMGVSSPNSCSSTLTINLASCAKRGINRNGAAWEVGYVRGSSQSCCPIFLLCFVLLG